MADPENCPLQFTSGLNYYSHIDTFPTNHEYFIKSAQFSPDGTHVLSTREDNVVDVFSLDDKFVQTNMYYQAKQTNEEPLTHINQCLQNVASMNTRESIFDAKWYPLMNCNDPSTYCFLTTCRDLPIHLWDIQTKNLRASYSGFDQYDELDSAYSVAFNLTADKIYAGTNRMIRVFDISYPGRNYTEIPTCKTRSDFTGQRGIISAISFNPDFSNSYAVGSYACSVGIYVENMDGCALEIRGLNDVGGITCLKWSPCGRMIWAGGRHSNIITCWDVRKSQKELGRVERNLNTNQKLSFDLDPWGKYLATGSQDGNVLIYDAINFQKVTGVDSIAHPASSLGTNLSCVNSVNFHPFSSIILSATGERTYNYSGQPFSVIDSDSDEDGSSSMKTDVSNLQQKTASGIQLWSVHSKRLQFPNESTG